MTFRWISGFLSSPIAGLAGVAVAGPVDDGLAAVIGGVVTGLVIGAGQALAGRLDPRRWIPATVVGMGAGLVLGAAVVSFGTSVPALAAMGALTGLPLGIVHALALPSGTRRRWAWAGALPPLWALGWTVTTLVGVDVQAQHTVFGAAGALTFSVLSGFVLDYVRSRPRRYPAATAEARSRTSSLA